MRDKVTLLTPEVKHRLDLFWTEFSLAISFITMIIFIFFGDDWLNRINNPTWFYFTFIWLFIVILWGIFAVVRHAEALAILLGEPYGSLILTLSIAAIEVIILANVLIFGGNSPTLTRDTLFAVIMIGLNGIVGICLLVGGLRYHEQIYNLEGSKAFLSVIIILTTITLVLPNFTRATTGPTFAAYQAVFLIIASLVIYAIFLVIQIISHSNYFVSPETTIAPEYGKKITLRPKLTLRTFYYHSLLLVAYLIPSIFLAKQIAVPINYTITTLNAPSILGGIIIAVLILTPEAVSAIHASLMNLLQRSVNILLGSVLATIGLTIPIIVGLGLVVNKTVILGLGRADITLLLITLILSILTFGSRRTNILQGALHLLLFITYIVLIFD